MQLTPSFILLLGSLFRITLSVYAIPLTRGQPGVVTLALKRTPMRRDLHPEMLLHVHNARGQRRLARMTGRALPSTREAERLTVREARVAARNSGRIGYPAAKLGSNKGFVVPSKVVSAIESAVDSATASANAAANDGLTAGNTPTAANSLALDIQGNDVGYLATVQMGTPPRDFKVLMDSGSADLWVGAEGCQSVNGGDCGNHVFLGQTSSSSFVDTQNPFQVTYGKGAVQGNIVTDDLVVAGLKLPGHTFGVAANETEDFSSSGTLFDGIMGLAQSTLSEQQTLTPVEALAKAGLIKDSIVSYKISRLSDQKNDGEATLGGLDSSKFDQNTLITSNNVNQKGFWEVALDAVSMNGADLGLTGRTAILDTGTTLLIVPPADAQAIHKAIPGSKDVGQGGFTVPCTTNASLALTIGQQSFAIDPRDLVFAAADQKGQNCVSGISAGQVGGPNEWLAGDVFLKNVYLSTDVGKNTIQLAKLT